MHNFRRVRRTLLALPAVVALAVGSAASTSSTASASNGALCVTINGKTICIPIEYLEAQIPFGDGCPQCGISIELGNEWLVIPALSESLAGQLLNDFVDLTNATVADDVQMRSAALAGFDRVAASGVADPNATPWGAVRGSTDDRGAGAAADVADALNLLHQADRARDARTADALNRRAVGELDAAVGSILEAAKVG